MRISALLLALWLPLSGAAQELPTPPVLPRADLDPSTLSDAELLDLIDRLERSGLDRPRPVSILGIPTGFGMPAGMGFVAAGLTNRRDRMRLGDWDGSVALGFGIGDAARGVAVTPVLDITSVTPSKFGSSGKLGVQVSRSLPLPSGWVGAVAVDLANLVTWGDSDVLDADAGIAFSAVRPASLRHGMPLMLSLGYGSGVAERGTESGAFAGLGVGLSAYAGASLAWYGDEAIGGLSFWPTRDKNLQLSVGIGDMTNRVDGRRLLLAISLSRPIRSLDPGSRQ